MIYTNLSKALNDLDPMLAIFSFTVLKVDQSTWKVPMATTENIKKKYSIAYQAFLGMACDCSRTPWRTPSLSKECGRLHALCFQMRTKISYFSVTITIIVYSKFLNSDESMF